MPKLESELALIDDKGDIIGDVSDDLLKGVDDYEIRLETAIRVMHEDRWTPSFAAQMYGVRVMDLIGK